MIQDAERQELVANERFITELLAARKLTDSKHWWESQGLWAFMSALVVGLMTILGSYCTGVKQKMREVAVARVDFELKQNREFLAGTAALMGRVFTTIDDQLWLAEGSLDSSPTERKQLVDRVNAVDKEWRDGQATTTFFFHLYYGNNDALLKAWEDTRTAVTAARSCSERVYMSTLNAKAPPNSCSQELSTASSKWLAVQRVLATDYTTRLVKTY